MTEGNDSFAREEERELYLARLEKLDRRAYDLDWRAWTPTIVPILLNVVVWGGGALIVLVKFGPGAALMVPIVGGIAFALVYFAIKRDIDKNHHGDS